MSTATEATSRVEGERLSLDPGESQCETTVQMHPRMVHVHVGLAPLTARTLNLVAVTDAFDAAGIVYFVVAALDSRASVVGVAADKREIVYKALGHPARLARVRHLAGLHCGLTDNLSIPDSTCRTSEPDRHRPQWSQE